MVADKGAGRTIRVCATFTTDALPHLQRWRGGGVVPHARAKMPTPYTGKAARQHHASIAQLVEQSRRNRQIGGSIPPGGSSTRSATRYCTITLSGTGALADLWTEMGGYVSGGHQ